MGIPWSLEVYDCGAKLLATVTEQRDIKDSSSNLAATIATDRHYPLFGRDQVSVYVHAVRAGDPVLSTITQNWKGGLDIVMNAAGADAGPGGDERVIAAIAAYMTWHPPYRRHRRQNKGPSFWSADDLLFRSILLSFLCLAEGWRRQRPVRSERHFTEQEKFTLGIERRARGTLLQSSTEPVFCPLRHQSSIERLRRGHTVGGGLAAGGTRVTEQQRRPADGGPAVLCMVCFDTHCKCPPAGSSRASRGAAVLCPCCFDIPCSYKASLSIKPLMSLDESVRLTLPCSGSGGRENEESTESVRVASLEA